MVIRALALAAAAAGCTALDEDFVCATDADCTSASGQPGRCEPLTNRCSVADSRCDGGNRYGDHAGELSGQCTVRDECVAEIRAGDTSTCVRRKDGAVWCWGDGNATPTEKLAPGDVVAIDVGGTRACARHASGAITCWPGDAPAFPANATPMLGPALGRDHGCTLGDGRVTCWGANNWAQLGKGPKTTVPRPSPDFVDNLTGVVAIAAGNDSSCALLDNHQLWCWGDDNRGQLGRGIGASDWTEVPDRFGGTSGVGVTSVSVGSSFLCVTTSTGRTYCGGRSDHGQMGDDTSPFTEEDFPFEVKDLGGLDVAQISAGGNHNSDFDSAIGVAGGHACALLRDGELRCWGVNDANQCAVASTADVLKPAIVRDGAGVSMKFSSVETGGKHTCARGAVDGTLYCWGANGKGQLGTGNTTGSAVPVQIPLPCDR